MDTPIKTDGYKQFKEINWIDSATTENSSKTIRLTTNYGYTFAISYGPTINCQMISIGNIYYLVANQFDVGESVKILKELLYTIRKQEIDKPMILLDLKQKYVEKIKELFKPYLKNNNYTGELITLKAPYTSTNGSEMCILLVNMDWEKVPNKF